MKTATSAAAMGSRREARERVLGLLYEADVRGLPLNELVEGLPVELDGYAVELLTGLETNLSQIDAAVDSTSHHWRIERMPVVDRCVLRIGAYEILMASDVPSGAAINEAVELAAEYSTADSGRFVNGVLGRLAEESLAGVE